MRKMVKHLLKKYKYPPEDYDTVVSKKLYRVMIRYVAPVMMLVLFLQPPGILA